MFRLLTRLRPPACQRPPRTLARQFDPGEILVSPAAAKLLEKNAASLETLLDRHSRGDWGDAPPEDQRTFLETLGDTHPHFASQWRLSVGTLWIMTKHDLAAGGRRTTSVLTLEEFFYR